jgi:fibronectin-binding autotransporter adhesin
LLQRTVDHARDEFTLFIWPVVAGGDGRFPLCPLLFRCHIYVGQFGRDLDLERGLELVRNRAGAGRRRPQFNSGSYAFQPSLTAVASVGGVWDTGGGTVTISGSALTLYGGVISGGSTGIEMDPGAGALTISSSLVLGSAQGWLNNSTGLLTVSAVANGGNLLSLVGSGTDKITGVVSGGGGLTVNASGGSVSLTAANTYSGPTNVIAGTLSLGISSALSTSSAITIGPGATMVSNVAGAIGTTATNTLTINNGLFLFPGTAAETLNRPVILSGGTIAALGTSPTSVTNLGVAYPFTLFIGGGQSNEIASISTSANSGTSLITSPSGTYLVLRNVGGATGSAQNQQPFLTPGANSTLDVNASLSQYNTNATVEDGVNINGSGTVVFNPPAGYPSQYSRNTDIISGTLQVGNTGAIPVGIIGNNTSALLSNVELDGGATAAGTLDLHGNSISVNGLTGSSSTVLGLVTNNMAGTTATLTDLTLSALTGVTGTTTYSGVLANGAGKLALAVGGPAAADSGSLTLTASNAYSGGTTVNSFATLVLGSSATLGSGNITINSGGVLNVSANTGGYNFTGGTFTAGRTSAPATDVLGSLNSQNTTLNLSPSSTLTVSGSLSLASGTLDYGLNDLLSLGGALSLSGSNYVALAPGLTGGSSGTTYTLITASGGIPSLSTIQSDFYLAGNSRIEAYSFGTSGMSVILSVTGQAGNLIWTGTGGTPNTWDTNTSPNWFNINNSAADKFQAGDNVTFNDSAGSSHATVLINSVVLPGSVTLSNTAVSYTFSGSSSIGGATSLVMNGPGTLTIANSNSYTGGTIINAGTLKLANANALPSGAAAGNVVLGSAGTGILDLNGTPVVNINGLSGGGGTVLGQVINSGAGTAALNLGNGGATATYSGVIADNNGSGGQVAIVMNGSGLQNLSGANTYSGGTTVNGGTLQAGSPAAFGTGVLTANAGTIDLAGYNVTVGNLSGTAGTITNNGFNPATLAVNQSMTTTFGGTLADGSFPLGFTMSGSGSLTLNGPATYSGTTSVNGGTLALGVVNPLQNSSQINIGPGAAVVLTVGEANGSGSPTAPMIISGLLEKGPGNFADYAQLNRPIIYLSGGTIASADEGQIGGYTPDGTPLNIAFCWGQGGPTGGTIATLPNSGASVFSVPGSGYFLLRTQGGSVQPQTNFPYFVSGPNSTLIVNASMSQFNDNNLYLDGINISGSGTVVFAPPAGYPNIYSHNTNIISGTLQVGNTGAIPFGTLSNTGGNGSQYVTAIYSNVELDGGATAAGTLDLNGNSITINGLQGFAGTVAGQVINSATGTVATLTEGYYGTSPTVFNGVLANGGGTLALVITGTNSLTLMGSNTYSGGTKINAGATLVLGQVGATLGSGNLTVNPSGVLDVSAYDPTGYNFTGGTLTAGRTSLVPPGTDIAGSLNLQNTVLNLVGTMTLGGATGNLTLGGGTLDYGQNDLISLAGAFSFTGSERFILGTPLIGSSAGITYTVITANAGVPSLATIQSDFSISGDTSSSQVYIWGTNGTVVTLTVSGANNLIWTGTGGVANTWDTSASPNWYSTSSSSASTFQLGDSVTFNDSAGSSHANVLINSTVQPGTLTFSNTAVNYTLSGSGSIAGPTSLVMNGPGTLTIATSNSYTGGTFINAGTLKAANANALPSGAAAGNVVLGSAGAGILDLNSTPVVYINGLSGGGGTALGQVINSGTGTATLSMGNGGAFATYSGVIADNYGSGGQVALAMSGGGLQNLSGSNSYSGGTTVAGGTLQLGNNSALGAGGLATSGSGVVDMNAYNPTVTSLSGSGGTILTSGGTSVLTVNQSTPSTFSGTLADGSGLTALVMSGSSSLTLSGPTTFSGPTIVTAGTLALGYAGGPKQENLLNSDLVVIGPGATMIVGTGELSGTTTGQMYIIGGLFEKGPGAFSQQNQLNRDITLSAGTIASADVGNIGGQALWNPGSPGLNVALVWGNKTNGLVISTSANSGTSVISVPSSGYFWLANGGGANNGQAQVNQPYFTTGVNSTLDVNASLAQFNVAVTVGTGINISGSGTVVFNPPAGYPNLYALNTNIISGTLQVGNTGAIPYGLIGGAYNTGALYSNVELDGSATPAGTLDVNGYSIFVNGLQGSPGNYVGQVVNSATGTTAALTDLALSGSTVYSGILANGGGTLALAVNGTNSLTLTGTNTYSGLTTISAGTLQLGDGLGDDGSIGNTAGVVNNSALVYAINGSQTAAYNISGSGSLTMLGSGMVILSPGAPGNTFSGGTTVADGTLVLDSSTALADGSSLIVGQGASSIFAPAMPAASPAVSAVPEPGTLALVIAGLATVAGTLRVPSARSPKLRRSHVAAGL